MKRLYIVPCMKAVKVQVANFIMTSKEDFAKGYQADSRESDRFDWDAEEEE